MDSHPIASPVARSPVLFSMLPQKEKREDAGEQSNISWNAMNKKKTLSSFSFSFLSLFLSPIVSSLCALKALSAVSESISSPSFCPGRRYSSLLFFSSFLRSNSTFPGWGHRLLFVSLSLPPSFPLCSFLSWEEEEEGRRQKRKEGSGDDKGTSEEAAEAAARRKDAFVMDLLRD